LPGNNLCGEKRNSLLKKYRDLSSIPVQAARLLSNRDGGSQLELVAAIS
jgi:hypothetical protein